MIQDAEFWMNVRSRESGGDPLFKTFLGLLHARQATLAVTSTTMEIEETNHLLIGEERRERAYGRVYTNEERKWMEDDLVECKKCFTNHYAKVTPNNTLHLMGVPDRRVSSATIRVLQRVMLYAVPIYGLRYKIFAMSIGKNSSCFVDRAEKRLMTFGESEGVNVTEHIKCRGCVAGDNYFAVITDSDQVWASGDLSINTSSKTVSRLGKTTTMYGVSAKALMLVGSSERLAFVSRDFKVHLLSAAKQHGYPLIPSRHVRFLALGRPSDAYMVGTDSILYKVARSEDAMSTPRRVLSFARIPVSRVACGAGFIIVIDQCGRLLTFGRNKLGQLGNNERQDFHRKVFRIRKLSMHFFVQVAAGDFHSLALTSSGIAYGSGSNAEGQLGLGQKISLTRSFKAIPLPCKCVGIAAGPSASAFALEDGSVYVSGSNENGRLGVLDDDGSSSSGTLFTPTRIPSIVNGIESYTLDFSGRTSGWLAKFARSEPERPPVPSSPSSDTDEVEEQADTPDSPSDDSSTESNREFRYHEPISPFNDGRGPVHPGQVKTKKNDCHCCLNDRTDPNSSRGLRYEISQQLSSDATFLQVILVLFTELSPLRECKCVWETGGMAEGANECFTLSVVLPHSSKMALGGYSASSYCERTWVKLSFTVENVSSEDLMKERVPSCDTGYKTCFCFQLHFRCTIWRQNTTRCGQLPPSSFYEHQHSLVSHNYLSHRIAHLTHLYLFQQSCLGLVSQECPSANDYFGSCTISGGNLLLTFSMHSFCFYVSHVGRVRIRSVKSKLKVFITGFGPFANVKVNPSSEIGKRVAEELRSPQQTTHFIELETSIRATKAFFTTLEKDVEELLAADPETRVLLCHFGVHSRERGGLLRVEVEGFNELFASAPDVDGVVFNHDLISPEDGALDRSRHSVLGTEPAATLLQKHLNRLNESIMVNAEEGRMAPHWIISHDAGRYLCNYCLYRSLQLQDRHQPHHVASVFLHICDPTLASDAEFNTGDLNPSVAFQIQQAGALVRAKPVTEPSLQRLFETHSPCYLFIFFPFLI
eukprot:gene7246-5094_t